MLIERPIQELSKKYRRLETMNYFSEVKTEEKNTPR